MADTDIAIKLAEDELRALVDDPLALEERGDADAVVPALPHQSFVRMARRLRDEGRLDVLVPNAAAEQLVSVLDLDAWHHDRVDVGRALDWLVLISDHYVADKPRGALADLIHEMDPEMWTFALLHGTRVIDLDPEVDDARQLAAEELVGMRLYESPDGFFVVGVPDDEHGHRVLHVLHRVYEDDLGEGRKLLLSIQSGMPALIEETLLRFRTGRLADLGFVPWDDAMKLFRPLDHRAAAQAEPRDFRWLRDEAPTGVLDAFRGVELLRRAMARLPDAEHGVRTREFMLLVNEVMAAQRFPPGDEGASERAVDQTQATLGLGLELLLQAVPGHPDPDAFLADRIGAIGLREVFRVGYGALFRLRRAALELHRQSRISLASVGSLLDRPWGPAVGALARWFPELPLESSRPGPARREEAAAVTRVRPLRGLADVARATELLAQAGALALLTFHGSGYGVDPVWIARADEPEKVVLGDLVRTAIVHAHMPGSQARLAPLTADDLAWARAHLLDGGRLVDAVRRDLSARCDELGIGKHTAALADNLLTRLRVELAGLETDADGNVDLRRTGGLLTVQTISMWLATRAGDRN
jgi:hypothetical protein